jgi:hypothetical protein
MIDRLFRSKTTYGREDRWIVGGLRGAVDCHAEIGGLPTAIVVHHPGPVPGWEGPRPCEVLDMRCWHASSVGDQALVSVLSGALTGMLGEGEDAVWAVLERCYRDYLGEQDD